MQMQKLQMYVIQIQLTLGRETMIVVVVCGTNTTSLGDKDSKVVAVEKHSCRIKEVGMYSSIL